MTLKELRKDYTYIKNHIGVMSPASIMHFYEKYLHGSVWFIFGSELNNCAIALKRKHIPLKWCSVQTDHKANTQCLRFRPHDKGTKEMLASRGAFIVTDNVEEMYSLYTCNTKSGHNKGYCFEKAVFDYYGVEGWEQDNKRADKGGDICVNGEEIQLKFAGKGSLATITTTTKLLNKIAELIEEMEKAC